MSEAVHTYARCVMCSINDAVLNGKHYDFSLDNYTTDVPPSVLAKVYFSCAAATPLPIFICWLLL